MISKRFVFGALAVVAAAFATPAITAEQVADPATSREFNAKMLMCSQCHGANGVPVRPGMPIIWGQQEPYLLKQLQDFRNKTRDVELMTWAAITLHDEAEMAAAASYFAKKGWPARAAATPAAATPAPRGMAVCQACHQTDYRGAPQAEGAPTPRLAGQSYEYLVETMRAPDGQRKNATMAALMAGFQPADREAMARYLSGL
jgi:cytochrome c553